MHRPCTPDFEWQGWTNDFGGFEIYDFGMFGGRKILAGIFQFGQLDLSRYRDSYIISDALWNFYGLEVRHWIFWGLYFGARMFLGCVWSPMDFFGFWFLPPFDHPCHLTSGVPPSPLGSWDLVLFQDVWSHFAISSSSTPILPASCGQRCWFLQVAVCDPLQ